AVKPSDKTDLDAALVQAKKLPKASWEAYRLVELGLRAKMEESKLQELARAIADPAIRGRAQLVLLQAQMKDSTKVVEDSAVVVEKDALAHAVAKLLQAEHNSRHGSGWGKLVQTWDAASKPFGEMGLALGTQGK